MGAILYIARKQTKNAVLRLVRRPARLIAFAVSAALIVWMLLDTPPRTAGRMDLSVLQAGYLVWLLALGTVSALSSLSSGASLFRMPDVNLLFVSPLSPKKILAYGLVRQTGRTFAGFAFLLFYSGMLMNAFRITAADIVTLIFGTVLFLAVVQMLALCLYCAANRGPAWRTAVRAFVLAVPLLIAFAVLAQVGGREISLPVLSSAAASPVLDVFPVIGWVRGAAFAAIAGDGRKAALFLAPTVAFFALSVLLLFKIDADYYEDVLSYAETSTGPRRTAKRKRHMVARAKWKTGRTGIGRGWGASAFFYKQLREARRSSRFAGAGSVLFLLLVNLAMAGVLTLIGGSRSHPATADAMLLSGCGLSVYILFFRSAAGSCSGELVKPYLYLAPDPPFQKLLWASLSAILGPAVDGAAVFAVLCAVLRANPFTGAACALAYASFGFLFTAGSVLGRRVLGGEPNRGMVMMLYMLLLFLILSPGAVGTLFAVFALKGSYAGAAPLLAAIPLVSWNALSSLLIFFLCRNLLSSCEN